MMNIKIPVVKLMLTSNKVIITMLKDFQGQHFRNVEFCIIWMFHVDFGSQFWKNAGWNIKKHLQLF